MSQPTVDPSLAGNVGSGVTFGLETGIAAGAALLVLVLVRLLLGWLERKRRVPSFVSHSVLVGLSLVALVAVVLTLKDPLRDQVLKFLGVLFSAVLAFSSTTLVGNGLAGVMLRAQRHFRGGDWLSVGDHFGQVAHRGLFFTTVQDESGDLLTLPNLHIATHPVTVVCPPTYISARVSLGYDVPRADVEGLLLEAAAAAGLEKSYVYVLELGDFSIRYRVSGKLAKADNLLTMKSNLKCRVLDALHAGGVEIVSPAFMNQRVLAQDRSFIPRVPVAPAAEAAPGPAPEVDTFDRGRKAKTLEQLEDAVGAVKERITALRGEIDASDSEERKQELGRDLEKLEKGLERLTREIEQKQVEPAG